MKTSRQKKRKEKQAFVILRPVWRSRALRKGNKYRLFNTNQYTCMDLKPEEKHHKISPSPVIRWRDKITNTDLLKITKQQPVETTIKTRSGTGFDTL